MLYSDAKMIFDNCWVKHTMHTCVLKKCVFGHTTTQFDSGKITCVTNRAVYSSHVFSKLRTAKNNLSDSISAFLHQPSIVTTVFHIIAIYATAEHRSLRCLLDDISRI